LETQGCQFAGGGSKETSREAGREDWRRAITNFCAVA
jgi:hypothetical protein